MRTARGVVVALFLVDVLTLQVVVSQWLENYEEETFDADLKEAGLTIADAKEFNRKYGSLPVSKADQAPSWNNMDPSEEDDLLLSPDYGLGRYRRAADNNTQTVISGEDDPCDTNSALCNDTGQECVYDSAYPQNYYCRCQEVFENQTGVCVAIPDSKKLYLTTTLQLQYHTNYSMQSSVIFMDFQNESQEAFSQEFTGLEGYKTLRVIQFRNINGMTQVVYSIFFTTNVTAATIVNVAYRVLFMEEKKDIQIGDQQYTLLNFTGIFSTLNDTYTVYDAVDWCSNNGLYKCSNLDRECNDGDVNQRYTCDCKKGFVAEDSECVDEKVVQYDMYPYGMAAGDTKVTHSDDSTERITIPTGFPVGTKIQTVAYVGINGLISFGRSKSGLSFRLERNAMMLCPYLSDIDTLSLPSEGEVYYQVYDNRMKNDTVFTKADREIQEFVQTKKFRSVLVLVFTWHKVSHYLTRGDARKREQVTFQAALISDGTNSYSLVYYKRGAIKWVHKPNTPIIIGLSKGPGHEVKQQVVSNTAQAFSGLDKYQGNTGRRGMWLYEMGKAYSPEQECQDWHQRNLPHKSNIEFWSEFLPPCPCSFFGLSRIWIPYRQYQDIVCYRLSFGTSFFSYPYSKECCFRIGGLFGVTLLQDKPSAGGMLGYNPAIFSLLRRHRTEDRRAHDVCCYKSAPEYCRLYYELRPVGWCSRRATFSFSIMLGDPHVITLDGKDYTFNGWGEYTMVQLQTTNVSFTLQGRTEKALTDNGTAINATVFTAFAASEGDVRVSVELEPSERQSMIIYADDKDYTLQFQQTPEFLVDEQKYTLERNNDSLALTFPSGISLSISVGVKLLDIEVSMPNKFKGEPKGLMGNFNDNRDDDFTLADGTKLSTNMTEREIFQRFGSTWAINNSESLFRYPPRKGPADFRHDDFVPIFLDEASPQDRTEAEKVCGKANLACIYDFIATGSQTVAQATKKTKDTADETETKIKNNAPEMNATKDIQALPGQPVSIQLNGSDKEDENNVTYFAADTATGNFTLNNATGLVTYQVTPNQTDNLQFFVVDSKQAASPVKAVVVVFCPTCNGRGKYDTSRPRPALSSQAYTYASCNCTPWWDGDDCEHDFDGCADDPCIPGQDCTDLPATEHKTSGKAYNCSACPTGYTENNGKCTDIDECNTTSHDVCQQNCTNTEGSYLCSCMEGYRLNLDGRLCEDINECVEKTSDCAQICTNIIGGYNCSCEDGYALNVSDNSCSQEQQAVATCETANCSQGCKVINNTTPECFCFPGYVVNPTNMSVCDDEDECKSGICSQKCNNSVGSFKCSCYAGFKLDEDSTSCAPCQSLTYGQDCSQQCECNGRSTDCNPVTGCVCEEGWQGSRCEMDVDECEETRGICGHGLQTCVNTDGSYRCECLDGYSKTSDNSDCEDVNECSEDSDLNTCTDLEDCVNTIGSFYCTCRAGYQKINGTNSNCTDSNECDNGAARCQQICINNVGSFSCDCNLGFRLAADRRTCETVEDVCAAALNCSFQCTLDEKNKPYCFCETGYNLGSDLQSCFDINECKDQSVGTCSHNCNNLPGTFECTCPVGMRLDNDQRTCLPCEAGTYGLNCAKECGCGQGSDRCDPATGCKCKSGWTGDKCDQDIDECQTINVANECSAQNARCENFPGGYRCACEQGYKKDTSTNICEDINECSSNPCSQRCENNAGSFLCLCNAGFTLNTTTSQCEDNNECRLTSTNRCTQKCVNTLGSYRCTCDRPGFILDNDGYTCKAKTECTNASVCARDNGGCFVNGTNGQDTCFCISGYQLDSNNDCQLEERDWCGEAGCEQNCANISTVPYFNCSCDTGYQLNDDARTCRECPSGWWGVNCSNQCICDVQNSRECTKDNGTCVCEVGWQGKDCKQDINECQPNPCVNNSDCYNTNGSYICVCQKGFFKGNDGNCTECAEGFYDDCSKSCECATLNTQSCNKQNGTCMCKSGWMGTNCSVDIDECTVQNNAHNCSGPHEKCRNKDGGFDCVCETNYQYNSTRICVGCPDWSYGSNCTENCTCNRTFSESCDKVSGICLCKPGWNGTMCDNNINECDASPCPDHSTCSDTEGSYHCTCNMGFQSQPDGNCTDVDECLNDKGGCDQMCNNTEGSFSCSCNNNYILSNDSKKCDELKFVGFTIKVNITIVSLTTILSDKKSSNYRELENSVRQELFESMKKTVVGLLAIIINSMREGSLVVDAEAKLNKALEADVVSSVAKAVVDLQNQELNISGQTGTVREVIVNNKTVSDACDFYETTSQCPPDTKCRLDSGYPSCRPLQKDDYKLVIGLGVGIPLFLIIVISIACLVYLHVRARRRSRRKSLWPVDDDQLSGVLSSKIATRGPLWKPARDTYTPDSLSSASSDYDKHHGKPRGSQRPVHETSPWNAHRRTPSDTYEPSSFSWDFLCNQILPPDQPFAIKRPKLESSPDPTYNTSWGEDGGSVL